MDNANGAIMGIHHVGLTVSNLQKSADFFVKLLGYKITGEKPQYPAKILSNGASIITIWQVEDPNNHTPFNRRKNVGLHHLALEVSDLDALHKLHRLFVANTIDIEFPPEARLSGPGHHMMTFIPGGPRLEFIVTT